MKKEKNTIRTLLSLITFGFLVFLVACGGSGEDSSIEFAISEDTLQVIKLAEGLDQPNGLAIDLDAEQFKNNAFVALFGSGAVVAIDENGVVTSIASGLAGPSSLLFDVLENAFFVTESQSNRISRVDFNVDPATVSEIAALPQGIFPRYIASDGQFRYVGARNTLLIDKDAIYNINTNSPQKIAEGFGNIGGLTFRIRDDRPELLVVDTQANSIYIVRIDDPTPDEVITEFDRFADDIDTPMAIAIGPASGFVYVAQDGTDEVVRFTADGKERNTVAKIASPSGLTFDANGALLVSSLPEGNIFKIVGLDEQTN